MRPTTVLALATPVAAVDVSLRLARSCTALAAVWRAVEPGQCLQTGANWWSAKFSDNPSSWNLACKIYDNAACPNGGVTLLRGLSNGQPSVCMGSDDPNWNRIKGARYNFPAKKRDGTDADDGPANGLPCGGPDFLEPEDGTQFNVTGVEETVLTDMVTQLSAGVIPEALICLKV